MADWKFDPDAWVRDRFEVFNADGGRGFEKGVRVIDCPFHPDRTKSAWVNVVHGRLGCFNPSCEAHGRIGVVEAVRRLEGFRTWHEALAWLRENYPGAPVYAAVEQVPFYDDWVRLPYGSRPLAGAGTLAGAEARAFLIRQWALGPDDVTRWDLHYCVAGKYAWRVIIPVVMGGARVGFTGRTFRNGEPKYLAAKSGDSKDPKAECGRPGSAWLYNYDALEVGGVGLLVEGQGDVMGWERRRKREDPTMPVAVGLFGSMLNEERAALLAAKRLRGVILALDLDAEGELTDALAMLSAWDLPAAVGYWDGAKDAGAGARLVAGPKVRTLRDRVGFMLKNVERM